ncbi:MAG TPA: DUF5060 domain-containing protein, partial [Acidobacteriota bacterium]|nr:DUF5060 domain-containing protein [Acidobacteriota bacterium]
MSNQPPRHANGILSVLLALACLFPWVQQATAIAGKTYQPTDRFGRFEVFFQATGNYANPYLEVEANAIFERPDGNQWKIPLFWKQDNIWGLRISPDIEGWWSFRVESSDPGLNKAAGRFECQPSGRRGSIQPMTSFPYHFAYQDGTPMWFMGDTAWALFTDNITEKHNREAVYRYIEARAAQGFNVLHSMLLSEAGWGNLGGPPFDDIGKGQINPGYWEEVDKRLDYLNQEGLVAGLALAWGDKRRVEPFAWKHLGDMKAKKRYARYIAARYSAFNVYFIVAGEWHAEIETTSGATEESVRRDFTAFGEALQKADPHGRMIAIHPMIEHGSVREFNESGWMSFGDYQQNYHHIHQRILQSRVYGKPVVNSEYGYYLRDADGDGIPDKDNSTSLDIIRHATWDIVMAGGYFVTGFGTTYFGGYRDPGPFDVTAAKNKVWEEQVQNIKRVFSGIEWWKLEPRDDLVRSDDARMSDRRYLGRAAPPEVAYWCLAQPGRRYLVYARGMTRSIALKTIGLGYDVYLFDPRTGKTRATETKREGQELQLACPDKQDWLFLVESRDESVGSPFARIGDGLRRCYAGGKAEHLGDRS